VTSSIALFGATGATGLLLAQRVLERGDRVVAYARNPSKLDIVDERLTVVDGELSNGPAIRDAIARSDTVISLLGPVGRGTAGERPITEGLKHVVAAMHERGARRLIATSTPSSADENDRFDVRFRLAVRMVKTFFRPAYDDIVASAAVVRRSGLDWTLVRIPLLKDKQRGAGVVAGYPGDGNVTMSLARSDLADFLMKQIQDTTFLQRAPVLSSRRARDASCTQVNVRGG
jgi:nucleoside-diphosphate-sugar epimerase